MGRVDDFFFFFFLKVLTGESINFQIKRERDRDWRMYTTTVTTRHEEKKKDDNHRKMEEDVEPVPLAGKRTPARLRIIWRNVIGIIVLHFLAVYGFVNGYRDAKLWTWIWSKYIVFRFTFFLSFPPFRIFLFIEFLFFSIQIDLSIIFSNIFIKRKLSFIHSFFNNREIIRLRLFFRPKVCFFFFSFSRYVIFIKISRTVLLPASE